MNKTAFTIMSLFLLVAACVASGYFMAKAESNSSESAEVAEKPLSPELQELVLPNSSAIFPQRQHSPRDICRSLSKQWQES